MTEARCLEELTWHFLGVAGVQPCRGEKLDKPGELFGLQNLLRMTADVWANLEEGAVRNSGGGKKKCCEAGMDGTRARDQPLEVDRTGRRDAPAGSARGRRGEAAGDGREFGRGQPEEIEEERRQRGEAVDRQADEPLFWIEQCDPQETGAGPHAPLRPSCLVSAREGSRFSIPRSGR